MDKIKFYSFISAILLLVASCSSSANLVVSNGVDLTKYKYIRLGNKTTGDANLDDIMMFVNNELERTKLQVISTTSLPDDFSGHTLSPSIQITSEKWYGGSTYITVTFYDYSTDERVAVIKSSGIGMSISQDQKLASKAFRKKLQSVFGKKE